MRRTRRGPYAHQQRERNLANAILNADNRLIQNLTREDLEFLLS